VQAGEVGERFGGAGTGQILEQPDAAAPDRQAGLELGLGLNVEGEHPIGLWQEQFADESEPDAAGCAGQQRSPDCGLEPAELLAQGGLAAAERGGGPADAASPGGGGEAPQRRPIGPSHLVVNLLDGLVDCVPARC
jgi:hypothetical protein